MLEIAIAFALGFGFGAVITAAVVFILSLPRIEDWPEDQLGAEATIGHSRLHSDPRKHQGNTPWLH